MKIKFQAPQQRGDNAHARPPVAEAEIHFDRNDNPLLEGLKLVGFTVRKSKRGGLFVLGPAKVYGPPEDRAFYDLLRPIDEREDWNIATEALRTEILSQYHLQHEETTDVA